MRTDPRQKTTSAPSAAATRSASASGNLPENIRKLTFASRRFSKTKTSITATRTSAGTRLFQACPARLLGTGAPGIFGARPCDASPVAMGSGGSCLVSRRVTSDGGVVISTRDSGSKMTPIWFRRARIAAARDELSAGYYVAGSSVVPAGPAGRRSGSGGVAPGRLVARDREADYQRDIDGEEDQHRREHHKSPHGVVPDEGELDEPAAITYESRPTGLRGRTCPREPPRPGQHDDIHASRTPPAPARKTGTASGGRRGRTTPCRCPDHGEHQRSGGDPGDGAKRCCEVAPAGAVGSARSSGRHPGHDDESCDLHQAGDRRCR